MQETLSHYFGYETFRPGQKEIITKILDHRNTLGVLPTGGGKSLCYQVPGLMLGGTTIVISPLISLMKDQVDQLKAMGIKAAYLNSSLTQKQQIDIEQELKQGDIQFFDFGIIRTGCYHLFINYFQSFFRFFNASHNRFIF